MKALGREPTNPFLGKYISTTWRDFAWDLTNKFELPFINTLSHAVLSRSSSLAADARTEDAGKFVLPLTRTNSHGS